ncbi:hypothetical protein Y032_0678g1447, partial [Ancylostoma ceylanicum]
MSGSWSRKRRNISVTTAANSCFGDAYKNALPLPTFLLQQQLQLARSMEKVLEEAELCGALNLAGRKMKDFPSEMSTKYDLSDLVSLDLSGNRLSDVPTCVCESRSLESLRLRGNVLRSVPLNILFLRSLTVLDLSNNKIVQLPLSLFELPLEIMLLTGNRLSSIPREIRQLSTTLVEFDVSCNFLTSIPADIALLKMLRVLNLRRNLIESFPTELCHLSLHTLDLSYNRIRRLPLHIGRMESLVELHIGSNPLQSPPASLIVKGREHIVKWMDIEASTGVHQDLSEYCDDSRSDFVFQNSARDRHNIGTNLPSNAVMRSQHSLSANIAGSDSGYASTTDDQRLHHEYGTSTYHSKVAACSGGVNKEVCKLSNGTDSAGLPLPRTCLKFTDVSSVAAVPSTKSDRVLINGVHKDEAANAGNDGGVKFVERGWTSLLKAPNSSAVTLQNGNAEDHCKTDLHTGRLDYLDSSNNNSSTAVNACCNSGSSSATVTPKELVTTTGKPISKVGPLVPPRTQPSSTISTQLQEAKALKEEVSTTVPGSVAKKWRSSTSPRLQKPAVSTNLPSTKTSNPPSSGSNQRSRLPSHVGRISNTVAAVPKSTLLDDQQRQKSVPRSTTVKNNKITVVNSNRSGLSSNCREVQNAAAAAEVLRKVFSERLDISLSDNLEGIALQLADGVHLCSLVNALRARTIPTFFTYSTVALTVPKAKRNVDSFVASCRKLGVSENGMPPSRKPLKYLIYYPFSVLTVAKTFIL